jgi:hypothetical protein
MKRKNLHLITIALSALLLLSFVLPVLGKQLETQPKTEKDKVIGEIENGFNNYVMENRIGLNANRTRVFSAFLHSNPSMQERLSEYTNFTLKEKENNGKPLQLANSTVGPIFKTVNAVINGTNYDVKFRHGVSADGTEFVRINLGCNGTDPEYYVDYYYLSILGVNYGEVSTLAVHFLPGNDEALHWKQEFDTMMDNLGTVQRVIWAISGIALTAAGGPAGAIAGVLVGILPEVNRNHFKTTVDNAYTQQNGLSVKFVGT